MSMRAQDGTVTFTPPISRRLAAAGWRYDEARNQFIADRGQEPVLR